MTALPEIEVIASDSDDLMQEATTLALVVPEGGKLDLMARRVNRMTKGAVERLVASEQFTKAEQGAALSLAFPSGVEVDTLVVLKLDKNAPQITARKAGAQAAKLAQGAVLTLLVAKHKHTQEIALGAVLRSYAFLAHKTEDEDSALKKIQIAIDKTEAVDPVFLDHIKARAEGIYFTRDLVNEPANILTTTEFAARLEAMKDIGLEVEVIDEDRLTSLEMKALLGVGQGSESPSKVVVMTWRGGGEEAPVALIGKGVVFDTGGISLKPAAGMEDMTMDMGGAGVVAGVMRTLALRKARANVVGLVGLVENMPDGRAQRPGDVVTSMKGDTIEIINTDAEGRLVLCDVMWYAQDTYQPRAMIDLATLTGAIIIGLGHENAGVFSNNDKLADALLAAAKAEGEGAWRMPLAPAYDKLLKSRVADMKNVGGRAAGSITAAQFLQRFVKEDTPWCHIDIAGVASVKDATSLAPAGATGWGVLTLDRLIADSYETE